MRKNDRGNATCADLFTHNRPEVRSLKLGNDLIACSDTARSVARKHQAGFARAARRVREIPQAYQQLRARHHRLSRYRIFSIAARSSLLSGSTRDLNAATGLPCLSVSSLWKFHAGCAACPSLSRIHL